MPPRLEAIGTRTIVLSTGVVSNSSGAWRSLGAGYSRFALRCVRAGAVGTSNWTCSIRGSLSTVNTTGAAVGAIGAYGPSTLINATQAIVGKIKLSTGLIPAQYVKYVVSGMTTAAGRLLRIELICVS